jgi:hypothetical protein
VRSLWTLLLGERRATLNAIARQPPAPIARVADGGRATIAGTVEPLGEMLRAPLSKHRCVYWRIEIEEVGVNDYHVCARDEGATPFLVRDGSGTARVIPDGAYIALGITTTRHGLVDPLLYDMFGAMRAQLNYLSSTVRFREYTIQPDARLRLSGTATREVDPNAPSDSYRGDLPSRPVFARARFTPLWIAG